MTMKFPDQSIGNYISRWVGAPIVAGPTKARFFFHKRLIFSIHSLLVFGFTTILTTVMWLSAIGFSGRGKHFNGKHFLTLRTLFRLCRNVYFQLYIMESFNKREAVSQHCAFHARLPAEVRPRNRSARAINSARSSLVIGASFSNNRSDVCQPPLAAMTVSAAQVSLHVYLSS